MTRPLLPALLGLFVVSGCFGPSQPPPEEDVVTVRRRANGLGKAPSPATAATRGTGGVSQFLDPDTLAALTSGASGAVAVDPSVPTPAPPTGSAFPSIVPSTGLQLSFEELTGQWGLRPYLSRPRAGHVAGAFKEALVVIEGDHRPSRETLEPGAERWSLDDSHDVQHGLKGEGFVLAQGLSLGVGAMAYDDSELWLAGGLAGLQNADGTQGSAALHLYRHPEGYASARKDEAARSMTTGRYAAAGGVVGGTFVIAGGVAKPGQVVSRVELVAIAGRAGAVDGPAMPVPVAGAASVVAQGRLYVLGGYTFTGGKPTPVDHVQVYDGTTGTWAKDGGSFAPAALPAKLHGAAAAYVPETGVLYLAGGFDEAGNPLDTVYSFSLTAGDRWVAQRPMPTARGLLSLTAFRGALWAIGGFGRERRALQTVEVFQP
ncbi:MAG: kelch repeat-containing protein [Candidatus Sericytochromatia bacterium]|nr:kelch repeat-containing protein [Candidatus Sericytochromatia bacterium]